MPKPRISLARLRVRPAGRSARLCSKRCDNIARPVDRSPNPREVGRWRRLLREDRERGMAEPEIPIEAFYDEATGLPK